MNDTSNTDSGVVKWRNRKTGTVYASVEFNGTPVATVTTEAGSVYNVDVVSLDAFTEPTSKTELDAQLHAILKEVNLNGYYDGMNGTGSGHSMAVAKQALTVLIAQREQAAELRGRIDASEMAASDISKGDIFIAHLLVTERIKSLKAKPND